MQYQNILSPIQVNPSVRTWKQSFVINQIALDTLVGCTEHRVPVVLSCSSWQHFENTLTVRMSWILNCDYCLWQLRCHRSFSLSFSFSFSLSSALVLVLHVILQRGVSSHMVFFLFVFLCSLSLYSNLVQHSSSLIKCALIKSNINPVLEKRVTCTSPTRGGKEVKESEREKERREKLMFWNWCDWGFWFIGSKRSLAGQKDLQQQPAIVTDGHWFWPSIAWFAYHLLSWVSSPQFESLPEASHLLFPKQFQSKFLLETFHNQIFLVFW